MHYAWIVMHALLLERVFTHTMLLEDLLDVDCKCVILLIIRSLCIMFVIP